MKFLYVDESGNSGNDRFLCFFGVQIDAYKLKKAMQVARPVFDDVQAAFGEPLKELKSSRMVNGAGGWKRVDAETRKNLFLRLCALLSDVAGIGLVYVVDRERYAQTTVHERPAWASTPWLTGATAIALQAQRLNQRAKNNKGLTVLIFDDNKVELPRLSDFLVASSADADAYYERTPKDDPFGCIVDTAFSIQSHHSQLVQVADACSYAVRRRAELEQDNGGEEWPGEHAFFREASAKFAPRVRFPAKTWAAEPHCGCAGWLRAVGCPNVKEWMEA